MWKYWIIGILAAALTTACVGWGLTAKNARNLKQQTVQQTKIIDSLLQRRMNVFDVQMNVNDYTKTTVYGKKQSGNITIPAVKEYRLILDSCSFKLK
jgi:hypothetical protein